MNNTEILFILHSSLRVACFKGKCAKNKRLFLAGAGLQAALRPCYNKQKKHR